MNNTVSFLFGLVVIVVALVWFFVILIGGALVGSVYSWFEKPKASSKTNPLAWWHRWKK